MKNALILFCLLSLNAFADGGTTNINNCNPVINVKGCCDSPCKTKTRTIIKKVIVEKPVVVTKEVIVEKPVEKVVYVEKRVVIKEKRKKNRVSLLGGMGPTKLSQPSSTEVDMIRGPVGGAMYQRSLNDTLSLGLQLQTNQTILGVVGLDF